MSDFVGIVRAALPAPAFEPADDADVVFCEEYVRHGDAVLAVVRANIRDPFYAVEVVAQRQLERPEIRAAITLMEQAARTRTAPELTRDAIVADMQRVYQDAVAERKLDSAIAAKRLQAQLLGLLIEKRELTIRKIEDMSTDELLRLIDKSPMIEGTAEEVEE